MKYLAFFMVGLLQLVVAQNTRVQLAWTGQTQAVGGGTQWRCPDAGTKGQHFDMQSRQLQLSWALPADWATDNGVLSWSQLQSEVVDRNTLGDIQETALPQQFEPTFHTVKAREQRLSVVQFNPFFRQQGQIYRVNGFEVQRTVGTRKGTLTNNVYPIQNSVLASGDWYRFYVTQSGGYRITKSFLRQLGLPVDQIDPRNLAVFGRGGRMLPLSNAEPYPFDLEENAVIGQGLDDGRLDEGDALIMYAEGMDHWDDDNQTHLNLYTDKAYYYITYLNRPGLRMSAYVPPATAPASTETTFDDYLFHEQDLNNIGKLGRMWFGELFGIQTDYTFTFNLHALANGSTPLLKAHFGANASSVTQFKIEANGQSLGTVNLAGTSDSVVASDATFSSSLPTQNDLSIKLSYDNQGNPTAKGYLDYLVITAKCNLTSTGNSFHFQWNNSSGVIQAVMNSTQGITQIWDISQPTAVRFMEVSGGNNFQFNTDLAASRTFYAVNYNQLAEPSIDRTARVANQNLKGQIMTNAQGQFQDIDYLIICPSRLQTQAQDLAQWHSQQRGLQVRVVLLEDIYQEFASGKQDVAAIRNLIKYVYFNASDPSKRVQYVNLFGDASYDYQNRISNNTNVVPIFHSVYSLTKGESSFATDDFYGMMDENEGDMSNSTSQGIDIATGRMLVTDATDAAQMVNKVKQYFEAASMGSWRNAITYISDDPDAYKLADKQMQFYQNRLADQVQSEKPFLNVKKVLLDAYVQESSSGGDRYPEAKADIFNAFEKGALVFNYLGHGGESGLANERIWDLYDGQNMHNQYKYPLFVTITCDFSRFDDPNLTSAGELTYKNPEGGAIAMITTVRTIGQITAQYFNDDLSESLFPANTDTYPTMAEALRRTKNLPTNLNSSRNVVTCLGDPALPLAIARPKIVLTQIDGVPIAQVTQPVKALAKTVIEGAVLTEQGQVDTSFNGDLAVQIYDKDLTRNTLRNDGVDAMVTAQGGTASTLTFRTLGEVIFRGNATVQNGVFRFEFIAPRDIRIPVGKGKVSLYAKNTATLSDKTGYNTDILIGGVNTAAQADVLAPRLRIYMNDETFVNGSITNASPYFLAFMEDESGMNTASGIGHDMVAVLDGNESAPIVMNDYYETYPNDYTKGKIRYPFRNLSVGLHTLTFKAWDVYNNPVSASLQFVVSDGQGVTLSHVLNYPNPFVDYTQFWFTHNKPYETLEVQVQVMTVTGKVVWTRNQHVYNEGFLSRDISWNGCDDFGDRLGKGVYLYKLSVKSLQSGEKAEKIEKLVIL